MAMTPHQFLLVLRVRYKLALLVLICTMAAVLVIGFFLPKKYTATASLVVDVRNRDPVAAMFMPSGTATQVEIIKSDRVAQRVVKLLMLDESQAMRQQWQEATSGENPFEGWLIAHLERNLSVKPQGDIINISYTAADPGLAATGANAFAQAYMDAVVEMKIEPAKQYAKWFGDQAKVLRENVEQAQARLSRYQQSKGIVERQEQLDYETAKLRDLSSQLTVVQAQTNDSRSRHKSGADTLPEVMGNPLITGLKSDIARREATLEETALNLGRNHPQYQRLVSELASLKKKLETEVLNITRSYSTASTVGQSNESVLMAAIEAQKRKLLALKSQRNELDVLQRDVDAATRAYDAVANRFNQTSLESQSTTQTNVSVLNPAVEPLTPSSPKPWRVMLLMSIALGILTSAGVTFMLEKLDPRIRSADDLAEMLQLPVLGIIPGARERASLPALGTAIPRLR
jgi:polysaccharide biosynthesis transport protein